MAEAAASWSGKRGCRDWGWRQRRSRTRPWGAAGLDGVLTAAVSLPLPRPLQPPPLTLPCSPRGRQATLCHGGGNEDADGSVAFAGATPAAGPPPPPSPRRPPPNSAARRRLRKEWFTSSSGEFLLSSGSEEYGGLGRRQLYTRFRCCWTDGLRDDGLAQAYYTTAQEYAIEEIARSIAINGIDEQLN
uniref:Uncharacterized protein n=1 Tax=Oryza nivara TaxID=4536 RepID=A0A0E0IAW2_ORYNI